MSLASAVIAESTYEVDELLVALALTDDLEPAATLVRRVYQPRGRMTWHAAYMAPDAANAVIEGGVTFSLDLKGGLPRWECAARILSETGKLSPQSARALLQANLDDLADGLLFRQADGNDGLIAFLQAAQDLDEGAVLDGFRRIDIDAARVTWAARLKGGQEEQATMRELLRFATRSGGAIAALGTDFKSAAGSR